MTEENKNPGTGGEGAFFGGAGAPPNSTATATPTQLDTENGNGVLTDAQREVQRTIREKHGIDIFAESLFDQEAGKFVGDDEALKHYYEQQKKEYKSLIKRAADTVVEHVQKFNIKQVVDKIASSTGDRKEFLFSTKDAIPTGALEREIQGLTEDKALLEKAQSVTQKTINTLEDKCDEFHRKGEEAKNRTYQNAKKASQAEKEMARLVEESQKIDTNYRANKISYEKSMEEKYNINQEIRRQDNIYRVANLSVKKEKIIGKLSEQSEKIYKYMLQDFYWTELSKISTGLTEVEYSISLRKEVLDMMIDLGDKNIFERNKIIDRIRKKEGIFVGTLENVKTLLKHYAGENERYISESESPLLKFKIEDRLLS
ncbi:hypothetical protein HYU07_05080 [Candidatus Woesearchaeota archaeon]|nr:hypothetical protein [Candidatus Woesearchaeota archaeon]